MVVTRALLDRSWVALNSSATFCDTLDQNLEFQANEVGPYFVNQVL